MEPAAVVGTDEWKALRACGLLGVPSMMERIESGLADEHDYRLMTWWTNPVVEVQGEFSRPPEVTELPPEKATSQYWLDWWEENSWQFLWAMPEQEQ